MKSQVKCWKVRDNGQLLLTLMKELEGDAHISLEGDLRALSLSTYAGASNQPTDVLKPSTVQTDFVVLPLESSASDKIYAALGGKVPKTVLHVQIEKSGVLQFAAYDNFYPECIFFGIAVTQRVIDSLVSDGVIRPQVEKQAKSR
jgi:hypothetical protein